MVSGGASAWQWIDLENPSEAELLAVAAEFGLHRTSVVDSLQPEHLPKYEAIGATAFMITRVFDSGADREADTIQELTNKVGIFYAEGYIITIHRGSSLLIQDIQEKYVATGLVNSTSELLLKLVKAIFKTYESPAHKLAEELDFYEAKTFLNQKMPPLIKGLYHLKRKATVCRRVLRLSEVVIDSMGQAGFQATAVQDLRDLYIHLQTQLEEVNEGTNNLINTYLSLSSQKTNEVMRVLTLFSAFFLPLTFIAGIYGMNFEFMPELRKTYGYPGALLAMGVVALAIYLWFRKKNWL
ncbi:hypothetical protein TH63_10155 [Rufibacter radiotolerans]|uniref:Magnesium transporter CorA n=1 Tax=Rufibacter radiotolerans TaxID=1379910 RepID=A0A0H4VQL2_9BACT|nr:hypothetical protein TH63_09460 [Rufibacter radiotolerans]AKQ47613.1 hypothetical protein TH63_10155 [Rufibacter radiotolerans]